MEHELLAQSVEQRPFKAWVLGSSPRQLTIHVSNTHPWSLILDNTYIANALEVITDKNVLVNLAAKRASQLNKGDRPLIDTPRDANNRPLALSMLEIALVEIAEGKISFEHIDA